MHYRCKFICCYQKLVNCFIDFISCINFLKPLKQKRTYKGILYKAALIPKLFNDPLPSCSLINFYFLLIHTENFDKSIILPFLVFTTFVFLLPVFFLHFKQYDNILL